MKPGIMLAYGNMRFLNLGVVAFIYFIFHAEIRRNKEGGEMGNRDIGRGF